MQFLLCGGGMSDVPGQHCQNRRVESSYEKQRTPQKLIFKDKCQGYCIHTRQKGGINWRCHTNTRSSGDISDMGGQGEELAGTDRWRFGFGSLQEWKSALGA